MRGWMCDRTLSWLCCFDWSKWVGWLWVAASIPTQPPFCHTVSIFILTVQKRPVASPTKLCSPRNRCHTVHPHVELIYHSLHSKAPRVKKKKKKKASNWNDMNLLVLIFLDLWYTRCTFLRLNCKSETFVLFIFKKYLILSLNYCILIAFFGVHFLNLWWWF